jgi:3-oxoacyl-[acyl-carrier protein] reductase
MNAAARAKLASRIPCRRVGQPAEIAEAAAYLCSSAAGYVTGVVLDVDGGIGIGSSLR